MQEKKAGLPMRKEEASPYRLGLVFIQTMPDDTSHQLWEEAPANQGSFRWRNIQWRTLGTTTSQTCYLFQEGRGASHDEASPLVSHGKGRIKCLSSAVLQQLRHKLVEDPTWKPDWNPIELVWNQVKRWLHCHRACPSSVGELTAKIKEFCHTQLMPTLFNKYIDHLARVIPVVIEKDGAASG